MPARRTQQEIPLKRSHILAAAVILYAFTGAAVAAEYKIGFVNAERLWRDSAPAKRAQQKLEKEFAPREAELQKQGKQVRDLQALLDKDGPTLGETERRNKEREFADINRGNPILQC